jgi:hypothetical protein
MLGSTDGALLGDKLGCIDGGTLNVGSLVGDTVGMVVVGDTVGLLLGPWLKLGATVGLSVGLRLIVGDGVGSFVGV